MYVVCLINIKLNAHYQQHMEGKVVFVLFSNVLIIKDIHFVLELKIAADEAGKLALDLFHVVRIIGP